MCRVFGTLKKYLKKKHFSSDDGLKNIVKDWVSSQPQEFRKQGILRLLNQWGRYAQACDNTSDKAFIYAHSVISYLFI
ncbi:hypothetical protein TNIN_230871 [Trichonephila inaurata madagascariensis]|uniref:Uncharacterized protein n=1 Tax=Trichonephila inaurata madagascariensis TaxID=2747483 RepID=A0A8X6XLB1_9ARAC|nr:hypothetical protein TNIN_230871 [Trichonephila inaurata madagascariensis]